MSKIFRNLTLDIGEDLESKLRRLEPELSSFRVIKKSVDARRRQPQWVVTVEVFFPSEELTVERFDVAQADVTKATVKGVKPIIVGSGPAGLFAAIRLVERGLPCILVEQGSVAEKRIAHINRFWRYGELNSTNNVCFGEGGAGLYSDGKLITRIKSPYIGYVMDRLIRFGAPEEIRFLANPHVGSDKIRRLIPRIRSFLSQNGCEMHFNWRMRELLFRDGHVRGIRADDGRELFSEHVILATGHSAEEVFDHLAESGVTIEGKSFAVGLRIEHPQSLINRIQYRDFAEHRELGAANYKLTNHDDASGIGVYSFCMCPGGYVLSSGTNTNGLVTNGMSNYARNSPFANAAIVISIDHAARFGKDTFGGIKFRQQLEAQALHYSRQFSDGKGIPVQTVPDFLEGRRGEALASSTPSGVAAAPLHELFPPDIYEQLRESLQVFDQRMRGFCGPQGQLHAVESRTSCPLRVPRDPQTLQSVSHPGLYPCGEGAGYAGGITSAAVDGIRVAEAIVASVTAAHL